jgi:hypothetical protein
MLGLAGEFLVAGELLRRGIRAAVTYGNAKRADVVAMDGLFTATLEVKTTSEPKWVLGAFLPPPSPDLWVLVYLPVPDIAAPEFFILSGEELHTLLLPEHELYVARYTERHGTKPTAKGVVSIHRKLIPDLHRSAWHKAAESLRRRTTA